MYYILNILSIGVILGALYNAALYGGFIGSLFLIANSFLFLNQNFYNNKNQKLRNFFFPEYIISNKLYGQYTIMWILHACILIMLIDHYTINVIPTFMIKNLSPQIDGVINTIPIFNSMKRYYLSVNNIDRYYLISNIIFVTSTLVLLGFIINIRNIIYTFFDASEIKNYLNVTSISALRNRNYFNSLLGFFVISAFTTSILYVSYFILFDSYFFKITAVDPTYAASPGALRNKYFLFGEGANNNVFLFTYSWLLPSSVLLLLPASIRMLILYLYNAWLHMRSRRET